MILNEGNGDRKLVAVHKALYVLQAKFKNGNQETLLSFFVENNSSENLQISPRKAISVSHPPAWLIDPVFLRDI